MPRFKTLPAVFAAALLLAIPVTVSAQPAAKGVKPGAPQGPIPVEAVRVAPKDVPVMLSAVGSLLAGESADITTEVPGRIEKILFDEGQPVKKNDVLLQIDKSLIETELQQATAAYNVAKATFNRDNTLKEKGFASSQKWDLSKADMETTRAAMENARIRLQKTTVRAPFDGITGLRNFSVGDFANTGQTLTSIVSINPLKLEFTIPEKNYAAIAEGQAIRVNVDAWPDKSFTGTIYAVDPQVDPQTRNFRAKAKIDNAEKHLRPGMYARVSIETNTRTQSLSVPEESVIPEGRDSFVMLVVDGKAQRRKVVLGYRAAGSVEVAEGLSAGDVVVTAGLQRVRENTPVTPTIRE